MFPIDIHAVNPIAPSWRTESDAVSMHGINRQQLESGDGDDVGCVRVLESLEHFEASAPVIAGKELYEHRCPHLESVKYQYRFVANAITGYEKPNSQLLLAEQYVTSVEHR